MSDASTKEPFTELDASLRREELDGLRLAVKGRLVVLVVLLVFSSFAFKGVLLYNTLVYIGVFAALSLIHLWISGTRFDRPWVKFLFVALEIAVLTQAVIMPNPFNPTPWPAPMVYRYDNFLYFFILLAVTVFSYSPRLVLWAGVATSLAWGAGIIWIASKPTVLAFSDLSPDATPFEALEFYMNPQVLVFSNLVKELLAPIIVSSLLALMVLRGRRIVERQVAADRERAMVRETFGQYVPEAVARAIIEDRGVLKPEQRTATILFVDIADFTNIAERMTPTDVVAMLNAYFAAVAEAIARHNGVINQFQGDAILATFNVPLADEHHARNAMSAAIEIQRIVSDSTFENRRLRARIGINTGTVVAGSVGGAGRLNYTVHGDAVNLAARLEHLNKEYETRILVSEATASLAGEGLPVERVGTISVRGKSGHVTVFSVPYERPTAGHGSPEHNEQSVHTA